MTDLEYQLDEAAEAITNAYYFTIQEQIGQEDGGIASMFEFESDGKFKDEIARPVVTQLIGDNHSDEIFEKFEKIFDCKFIKSQIEKRWSRPSDVNVDNNEDIETISKATFGILNKAIQKEFPHFQGLDESSGISLNRVTSAYVKQENSFDANDTPATTPGM
jgi:hypothetical protein